jgi:YARHG domain
MKLLLIPALVAVAAAAIAPASAGDIQGDAYDCKDLWVMRNEIFKNNGFCFKSAKAISYFGNAGCSYDSQAQVPLSETDRIVIRDIKRSVARQGC